MLYSYNNQYPTELPFRITLTNGRTRTDPSTFTAEEIADAGYVLVDNAPSYDYPNKLEWTGTDWLVREPNQTEIANKWFEIQVECKRLLTETDYKVIKAYETGVSVDSGYTTYRQALRDLYNNVNNVNPWTVEFPVLSVADI